MNQLGGQHSEISLISFSDEALSSLLDNLVELNSTVLIIDRDNRLLESATFLQYLNRLDCSVLIVR